MVVVLGAVMFVVIQWFSCYNKVMTSRQICLPVWKADTGTFTDSYQWHLRFVPQFFGADSKLSGTDRKPWEEIFQRASLFRPYPCRTLTCCRYLLPGRLENAIETSDSMRSRGYGLKGRTAFSIYQIYEEG